MALEIYLIYPQGNYISASPETPYLQIGENKYGKPILDRIITPATSLEDAARCALVSLESTVRSNISVGPPLELAIHTADHIMEPYHQKLTLNSPMYKSLQKQWNEGLRQAFNRIFRYDYDRDIYPFDRVYIYDLDSPALRKVNNGWWLNNEIRSAVLSPKLGYILARLMGTEEVRLWHDQVVLKPGLGPEGEETVAGNIGWHQDYAHWQVASSQNMATLWIALQDTDLSNGGMRTIVWSHRWGLVPDSDTFHEKDLSVLKDKYSKTHDWVDEPCILKAGQASVHHCLCFHGSGPNVTQEPRMGLIMHCMPYGTYYRGRIDPYAKILPGRKGNRHANVPLLGPNA